MKILILTASTNSNGIKEIAKSIEKAFLYNGCEVKVAKFNNVTSSGDSGFEVLKNNLLRKFPNLTDAFFNIGKTVNKWKITNKLAGNKLEDFIKTNGFDFVICIHEYAMIRVSMLKKSGQLKIPWFGLIANYDTNDDLKDMLLDGFFLPNEEVYEILIKTGFNKEKLFVTGIPISETFYENISKEKARNYLAIQQGKKVVVIRADGISDNNLLMLCRKLKSINRDDVAVFVMCDRYLNTKSKLEAEFKNSNILPIIQNEIQNTYLRCADAIICKPIAYMQTENSACNVPTIQVYANTEEEKQNAKVFEDFGIAAFAKNENDVLEMLYKLFQMPDVTDCFIENYKDYVIQNGANNIVEIIRKFKKED